MLESWRSFLEVCRTGSFSAAAEELGFSQSAVSRQVAGLERETGARLLHRHARGVEPTPAGEAFGHHARIVVAEADRAVRAAHAADAVVPERLAVGATPSAAASIVPAALRRLVDDHGVRWSVRPALTAELEVLVASGELDVAVVTDAPPGLQADSQLRREVLGVDEMCVIVPAGHSAAGRDRASLAAFAADTWVEDDAGSAALLRRHAARADFEPRLDVDAVDLLGKIAMVAAGHAVALVPGLLAGSLPRDVVAVRLADAPTRGLYALLPTRADPPPPIVSDVVRHVSEALSLTG
ncbi:LysR family transcriptional regulator [Haloactinopolyspora alba]|uniref:LysR family transcriptional regulator n=1 Tax=Haloactinopolyspora alba TaxID=648780 RepID=UPI00197AA919|nr:LysR family transcriptional regulator [Haloactinopolyspora alba]